MRKILIFLFCFLVIPNVFAKGRVRNVEFKDMPVDVQISLGQITEVVFEERISNLAKGFPSSQLQVEAKNQRLHLLPLVAKSATLYVTTIDGVSIPLNLIITKEDWDIRVSVEGAKKVRRNKEESGTIVLMRDLITGVEPAGSTKIDGDVEVFNSGGISLRMDTVYELPNSKGFILIAENLLDRPVVFPIQKIQYPNLLAISSDKAVLAPKGKEGSKIRVYMVVRQ